MGMRFNFKKCNVLHVHPKHMQKNIRFYELNGSILSEVVSAKYLGVLFSNDMSSSPHIQSVIHKAHQRLGFVRRNLRGAPYRYRDTAYQTLVRSQLEYAAVVLDPIQKGEKDKLEQVQRKAARWARGRYGIVSVTLLLRELGWPTLEDRRRNQRLVMFYKILHDLIAIPPDKIGIQRATRPARHPRNRDNLQRSRASYRSSPLWDSTVFRTIPEWNDLPATIAEADSLSVFKSRLTAPRP